MLNNNVTTYMFIRRSYSSTCSTAIYSFGVTLRTFFVISLIFLQFQGVLCRSLYANSYLKGYSSIRIIHLCLKFIRGRYNDSTVLNFIAKWFQHFSLTINKTRENKRLIVFYQTILSDATYSLPQVQSSDAAPSGIERKTNPHLHPLTIHLKSQYRS